MKKKPLKHKNTNRITEEQIIYLLHGIVFAGDPEPFTDEKERRQAWEKHRDYLLSLRKDSIHYSDDETTFFTYPAGTRPVAWWDYDSPEPREPGTSETEQLHRMGEIDDEEMHVIIKMKEEYEQLLRG